MKKHNLKSLELNKKSIAKITSNKVKGGFITITTTTTIGDFTKSCPRNCGSQL